MSPQPYVIMYHQRNALIMLHTIQYTILKQIHVKHAFTHEEDLVHIILDQQTFLNFRINKMEPSSSLLKWILYFHHRDR